MGDAFVQGCAPRSEVGWVLIRTRIASPDRIARQLERAEGYLLLDMHARALEILQERGDWASRQFEASVLTGLALSRLGRYRDALKPLERAIVLRPGDETVSITLAWCYKRTHHLAQAIDVLERALAGSPQQPLIHYNLACYWSLAGYAERAFPYLSTALQLQPDLLKRLSGDPDLEPLRRYPEYQRLTTAFWKASH